MPLSKRNAENPAGAVWAAVGLALTAVTLLGAGAVQLTDPLPREGVFALLALGGVPAVALMSVAIGRGLHARRELGVSARRRSSSLGIRLAVVGLGLGALGTAIFAGDCQRRIHQKNQWVAEAQAVVEAMLAAGEQIPPATREDLGEFQGLSGEGYVGASWNILGFEYLVADRDAHFANGIIPVRIVITETTPSYPAKERVTIREVEVLNALYRKDAPPPKTPLTGLEIRVEHPELRKL